MKIKYKRFWQLVALALILFLTTRPVHAYWLDIALPKQSNQSGVVVIGYWSKFTPNGEDVIVFDPDNPPETIKKGTLVIVHQDDGSLVVYQSLHDQKKGDPDYDPRYPNEQWTQQMTYSEDTAEYRWFHHYERGDLVIYGGRVYQYDYGIRHNPNTETQKVPGYGIRWRVYSEDPTIPYWYRYKVYNQGDIVIHQGNYYRSLLDKNSGFYPNISANNAWELIGPVDPSDLDEENEINSAELEKSGEAEEILVEEPIEAEAVETASEVGPVEEGQIDSETEDQSELRMNEESSVNQEPSDDIEKNAKP